MIKGAVPTRHGIDLATVSTACAPSYTRAQIDGQATDRSSVAVASPICPYLSRPCSQVLLRLLRLLDHGGPTLDVLGVRGRTARDRRSVHPALAPQDAQGLADGGAAHGAGLSLVDGAEQGEAGGEDEDVAAGDADPPTALAADLPGAVEAEAGGVEEGGALAVAGDEGPEAAEGAAEEPALGGQGGGGQEGGEEADAAPGGADGAGDKERHAQHARRQPVEEGHRVLQQRLVREQRERAVHQREEFGHGREGREPELEVRPGAAGVVRVQDGARLAQRPPRAPPRNQRWVGRAAAGRRAAKRQMLPQEVPMAPVTKSAMRSTRAASRLRKGIGSFSSALYASNANAPYTSVKNLATDGKAASQNLRYVRAQLGSCGCRMAHDVWLSAGWAGAVMGEMRERAAPLGRVCATAGKRMGDTKAGHLSLLSSARASTMSKVPGQGFATDV
nr:hypothetical protein CFP56_16512 [Quercus suber]